MRPATAISCVPAFGHAANALPCTLQPLRGITHVHLTIAGKLEAQDSRDGEEKRVLRWRQEVLLGKELDLGKTTREGSAFSPIMTRGTGLLGL